jgi:hypothetical protein
MADINNNVIVLGFEKVIKRKKEEHWVTYGSRGNIQNAQTSDNIKRLMPMSEDHDDFDDIQQRDPTGTKLMHMKYVWAQIEPAYTAWLKGEELPEDGIPLSNWAGVSKYHVAELRKNKVRTVEELASISDSQVERIQLPEMRKLRSAAISYLEGKEGSDLVGSLAKTQEQLDAALLVMEEMRKEMQSLKAGPAKAPAKQKAKAA